jgi:hypothetical protein
VVMTPYLGQKRLIVEMMRVAEVAQVAVQRQSSVRYHPTTIL